MPAATNSTNQDIIAKVIKAAAKLDAKAGAASGFIAGLFARAISEDLRQYEAGELAACALGAWKHLQQRVPGTPSVRISNPGITAKSDLGLPAPVTVIDLVNDNMPFLVDSVMSELNERGLAVHLVAHPILTVTRTPKGRLRSVLDAAAPGKPGLRESVMHIHVGFMDSASQRDALAQTIMEIFQEVRLTVNDWRAMMTRVNSVIDISKTNPPPLPVDEIAEGIQFLNWLVDENFTFLGMREYVFDGEGAINSLPRSGLGILRDPNVKVLRRGREMVTFTPELREFLMRPVPLIITKANVRSRVHRRAHMDYIGVKLYSDEGKLCGELRIVGLFTSTAYTRSARLMPYLRRKIDHVLNAAGFDSGSHSGKALINVLEHFPRDELFQIDEETLTEFALAIMQLDEHPRLRVLYRIDKFDRFVSVFVYVPRDRFSSDVRIRIGDYLARVFAGRVSSFYPAFLEGSLVRVHYILGRYEGETPTPSRARIESDIAAIVRSWNDNLYGELATAFPSGDFATLYARYAQAFSAAYREAFGAGTALDDIRIIERLGEQQPISISFVTRAGEEDQPQRVSLRILHCGSPIALSSRVPVLENMGFNSVSERSYRISPQGGGRVWLHDMTLERADGRAVDLPSLSGKLEDCFGAIWAGKAENDGYNALVLHAGLAWRDVAVLRTYSRYARQIRVPFSQDYLWQTLNRHHAIAALLVALFHTRFDPAFKGSAKKRAEAGDAVSARIEEALQAVDSLDEDRIIRRFVNLIMASLRTNIYQRDENGQERPAMAIKINSRAVDAMPEPRPFAEITVYSPRLEGLHLRFGKVARGGLRWSDRPQDFRTEVLGLVKAQQVKNAVIVPVGAKGGFVPKHLPDASDREAFIQEGIAAYKIFVSSLLDVTDNISGDSIVPPRDVVRQDNDDPYLVVAADKGTATFSDIANGISQSRDFWLDDAFASGGSAGYDHKKMGITARGGWEAVKRHFREMDIDIQTTPFTVVGVGDMSGDVFGNAMLLSQQTRLVAAFDHRDIFIDPDPDPASSLAERKRLFALARSSWQDYDKTLISKGGGVFSRRDKSIPLSPQMQALTGLAKASATPFEIMSALLKADADLLWFGGIGTYVRASRESDEQAGDRANDPIRVTAKSLRVKVIGEGANLGMTQRARIEFASAGGRVNSDAIDNSAGVNSSDVEVNIKIAFGQVVRAGTMSVAERNKLLVKMTPDVAQLVLRNNYLQTLAISLVQRAGMEDFSFQARFMRDLEQAGLLDRAVEDMPDDAELAEREKAGVPLTRPEIAVLLAYAKITLYDELLASAVPDDAYLGKELMRYFPAEMQKRYGDAIASHRLRREIIATMLANSIINRGGPTFVNRLESQTGADVARIAAAYAAVRDSFDLTGLNNQIDALDTVIPGQLQLDLYARLQDLLRDQVHWFLRNVQFTGGLAGIIECYRAGIEALYGELGRILPQAPAVRLEEDAAMLAEKGLPATLARRLAAMPYLATAPDIILVAGDTGKSVAQVARVFFAVSVHFETDRLVAAAQQLAVSDYYDRLALDRVLESFNDARRQITALTVRTGKTGAEALAAWAGPRAGDVERSRRTLTEIASDPDLTLSKLAVGASLLRDLIRM